MATPTARRIRWEVLPLSKAELKALQEAGPDQGRAALTSMPATLQDIDLTLPRWKVSRDGETLARTKTKADAVEVATTTARSAWRTCGTLATLKIKGRDGRIQDERTYGRDPHSIKG